MSEKGYGYAGNRVTFLILKNLNKKEESEYRFFLKEKDLEKYNQYLNFEKEYKKFL